METHKYTASSILLGLSFQDHNGHQRVHVSLIIISLWLQIVSPIKRTLVSHTLYTINITNTHENTAIPLWCICITTICLNLVLLLIWFWLCKRWNEDEFNNNQTKVKHRLSICNVNSKTTPAKMFSKKMLQREVQWFNKCWKCETLTQNKFEIEKDVNWTQRRKLVKMKTGLELAKN